MPQDLGPTKFRPMNVAVVPGSNAAKYFRARSLLPSGILDELGIRVPGMPATPQHNLHRFPGKIISDLTYTNFYLGGESSWSKSDIENIDRALDASMNDEHLNNVMIQYYDNKPLKTIFKPSTILPGSKPTRYSQGDVEGLVKKMYEEGKLAGFDYGCTVFNFLLPSGAVLTTDEELMHTKPVSVHERITHNPAHPEHEVDSLSGLGGYHGSVHVTKEVTVYYAIGAYSERKDGRDNGIVVFDEPWKNVVATFYHELQEARTDPDVEDAIRAGDDKEATRFLGWMSQQGEECGDYPVTEAGMSLEQVMKEVKLCAGDAMVPVQFQYSNAVKGPEGPIAKPHPLPKK